MNEWFFIMWMEKKSEENKDEKGMDQCYRRTSQMYFIGKIEQAMKIPITSW